MGRRQKRSNNGITLIALVITIKYQVKKNI